MAMASMNRRTCFFRLSMLPYARIEHLWCYSPVTLANAMGGERQTMIHGVAISQAQIAAFCHRWKVTELALFGSILRANLRPDSDVDVLVSFAPDATWSLFDLVAMQNDLRVRKSTTSRTHQAGSGCDRG
jgi:predicted nucleotidyltransferase